MIIFKYRAKKRSTGHWIYGDLNRHPIHYECQIIENGVILHDVLSETVGVYIGRKDKNDREIYQGDRIKLTCDSVSEKLGHAKGEWEGEVLYDKKRCQFVVKIEGSWGPVDWQFGSTDFNGHPYTLEVIGTIHD